MNTKNKPEQIIINTNFYYNSKDLLLMPLLIAYCLCLCLCFLLSKAKDKTKSIFFAF